jgi:hypothetical protein
MEVEPNERDQVMTWAESQGDFLNSSVQRFVGPDPFAKVVEKLSLMRKNFSVRFPGNSSELKNRFLKEFQASRYAFFA